MLTGGRSLLPCVFRHSLYARFAATALLTLHTTPSRLLLTCILDMVLTASSSYTAQLHRLPSPIPHPPSHYYEGMVFPHNTSYRTYPLPHPRQPIHHRVLTSYPSSQTGLFSNRTPHTAPLSQSFHTCTSPYAASPCTSSIGFFSSRLHTHIY